MSKNHNPQLCSACRRKHSGKRKQEDDGGRDEGGKWCNGANDINHDQSKLLRIMYIYESLLAVIGIRAHQSGRHVT
ncbi:hypothetical protein SeMB42_g03067 [Synchytrium endobioticum]|uniref:Uncharacterized protein n=1 Tax=Synchytrium endobioticum TaxID=286115 RepID=A0A507DGX3_9FUNG|nr:hypothetical protein SeMB42_g03067 [Synchytrium endobioticum]TPX50487.1 hypothetical protein SeLEV6574_g00863 [Synchytrium endobioticum]